MKESSRKIKIDGIIYCFTNKTNGRQYVGLTKNKLKIRLNTHHNMVASGAPLLVKAIKKYGWDNFIIESIDTAKTLGELNDKEIYWIKKLKTKAPNGYNLTDGGFTNEAAMEANKESVICFTNNKTYRSIIEASEDTGVANYLISFNCIGRQDTAGGMVFEYLDKEKRALGKKEKQKRKIAREEKVISIRNINIGEIYFNLTDAERKTGVSRNVVRMCASGEMDSSKGFKFEYLDNNKKDLSYKIIEKRRKEKERRRKKKTKIRLVSTNEIFFGMTEASKITGVHEGAIYAVCMGLNDTANDLVFEYVDKKLKKIATENKIKRKIIRDKANKEKIALMSKTMSKPVMCLELNKTFKSITEASKITGIGEGAINRSIKSQKPGRAKLTFVRINKEK